MVEVREDLKVLKSMILEDGRIVTVGDEVEFVDSINGDIVTARVVKLTASTKTKPSLIDYVSHSAEHKTQSIAFENIDNFVIIDSVIEANTNL